MAHLLLYDFVNQEAKAEFEHNITYHTMVHEQIHRFYRGFRRDAHPMAVMCGVVERFCFLSRSLDIYDPEQREISAHRLIAKSQHYCDDDEMVYGTPFMYPRNDLNFAKLSVYVLCCSG